MIDLDNTVKNGFDFNKRFNMDTDIGLAFISLKIALKAYFSTYQTFKAQLNIFNNSEITPEEIDYNHRNSYCEASAETIVHFQHFAELVCKKILKDKDGLLSLYKQSSNGDLFFYTNKTIALKL